MINRKRYIANGIIILIFFSSFLFYAFQSGITGRTLKNGEGCSCHAASPSSDVSVVISGPDQLAPDETANYTVTITGGPLAGGGTNIAASAGILVPLDGLKKVGDELTHVSPRTASSGSVVFNFTYTAPSTSGDVILYANGNSVNLNGANTGDVWNFASNKTIAVNVSTGVDDDNLVNTFELGQNYPNPFNPATIISYRIPEDASGQKVLLKVYDLMGREVAELVNETKSSGSYSVNFEAKDLSSGVYLYKLQAGSYSITKKMNLLK